MAYRPKKKERITEIIFNEYDKIVSVTTCNTQLKKRLLEYSRRYPDLCKKIYENDEMVEFEIAKGRLSFRLIPPYSQTRKETAKALMKNINLKEGDSM